jgi:4-carboxymuconolactone decarboxylase
MARLPDLRDDLPGGDNAGYERMLASRTAHGVGLYGPYVPLLWNVSVTERLESFGSYLKFESPLPREVYQFVVLAVAARSGVAFEWNDHVTHARREGVNDDVIAALRADHRSSTALTDRQRDVLAVVDAAHRRVDLPQSLVDAVTDDLGRSALVEIVVLTGFYELFGAVSVGFGIDDDPTAGQG